MSCAFLLAALLAAEPIDGRLAAMSVEELLACSGDAERCQASDWDLARELARREGSKALLAQFADAIAARRRVVVFALYLLESDEQVAQLMRQESRSPDEEVRYYALDYLAKRCDEQALRRLSAPPYKVRAACQQWASTIALFGQCRYAPATPLFVSSLGHACGNVVSAAETSLRALYADAPTNFDSLAEEKKYFQSRADSFGPSCKTDANCNKGRSCVSHSGFAGGVGRHTCEIPCLPRSVSSCAAGLRCIAFADGPSTQEGGVCMPLGFAPEPPTKTRK